MGSLGRLLQSHVQVFGQFYGDGSCGLIGHLDLLTSRCLVCQQCRYRTIQPCPLYVRFTALTSVFAGWWLDGTMSLPGRQTDGHFLALEYIRLAGNPFFTRQQRARTSCHCRRQWLCLWNCRDLGYRHGRRPRICCQSDRGPDHGILDSRHNRQSYIHIAGAATFAASTIERKPNHGSGARSS